MRTPRTSIAIAAVLAMAIPVVAASSWQPGGVSGGTKTGAANCGAVTGTYGAIAAFTQVSGGANEIKSHGTLGGLWAGAQFALATTAPATITDEHSHHWDKSGGGTPDASTLQAQTVTSQIFNGSCAQMTPSDPQWWWRPTVNANVQPPKIQRLNTSTSNWDDQNPDNQFGDSGPGGINAVQPTGQEPAAPAATYNSLNQRVTFTLPASADGTSYRVMWGLDTSVTGSVDNSTVTGWVQGLHIDCASAVSDADAGDDFDLWP